MEVREHFDKFYEKLLFLDNVVGKEEQTFSPDKYQTVDSKNGIPIFNTVYEENLNDKYVFFKKDGIIMCLQYGEWYNKKYKEIRLSIYRDKDYTGETISIKDAIKLVKEYMNTHYSKYMERINKLIYNANGDKRKIKYRPNNIFDIKNLKIIRIFDLDITDDDIDEITTFPNIRELSTNRCNIDGSISRIKCNLYRDYQSKFSNNKVFNDANIEYMMLSESEFIDKSIYNTRINAKEMDLNDLNIPYDEFFLKTRLDSLSKLTINGVTLNPRDTAFLKCLASLKEFDLSINTNSLSFVDYFHKLESFNGDIDLLDEKELERLKRIYKEKVEYLKSLGIDDNAIKRSLIRYYIADKIKSNEFLSTISVSPYSLLEWGTKILNSSDEEIKEYINYLKSLPYSKRLEIGRGISPFIVETKRDDFYKLLGIELMSGDNEYKTKFVNAFGTNIYKSPRYNYTDTIPIYGSDGKILETIEHTKEREVEYNEYYTGYTSNIVHNDNNVFDYYYNRYISTSDKVEYLFSLIMDHPILRSKIDYNKIISEQLDIKNKIKKLEDIEFEDLFGYFISSVHREFVEEIIEKDGKKISSYTMLKDPYFDSGVFPNVRSVLRHFRTYESIQGTVEAKFEEDNISEEEQQKVINRINEYIKYLNELDKLYRKLKSYDYIIEFVLKEYKDVFESLNKEDYINFYLDDIDKFLSRFDFDDDTRKFFYYYILLKKEIAILDLESEQNILNDYAFLLDEEKSIGDIISSYKWNHEDDDIEDILEEIEDYDDYYYIRTYLELNNRLMVLKQLLNKELSKEREELYKEMIPLIDKLSIDELKEIKLTFPVVSEVTDRFKKYVDYLYFYLYKKYPKWIELELACREKLPETFESAQTLEYHPAGTYHINERTRINKNNIFC